jgi:hypothetical protein
MVNYPLPISAAARGAEIECDLGDGPTDGSNPVS